MQIKSCGKSVVGASSPCVTVAVRAEPNDPVFVRNSETVKRVRSHHQEEVKHLKKRIKVERKTALCVRNDVKNTHMCREKLITPTFSLILEAIAEQYLFL